MTKIIWKKSGQTKYIIEKYYYKIRIWNEGNLLIVWPISTYPVFIRLSIMVYPTFLFIPKIKPALLVTLWTLDKFIAMEFSSAVGAFLRSNHIWCMFIVLQKNCPPERNLLVFKDNPNVAFPISQSCSPAMFLELIRSQIPYSWKTQQSSLLFTPARYRPPVMDDPK